MTYRERLLITALEDSIQAQRSLQKALFEYADRTEKDTYAVKPSEEKTKGGQYIPVVIPPEVPAGGDQVWPMYPPYVPPNTTTIGSGNTQEFPAKVDLHNTSEDTPF